jgi:hypothetical protein
MDPGERCVCLSWHHIRFSILCWNASNFIETLPAQMADIKGVRCLLVCIHARRYANSTEIYLGLEFHISTAVNIIRTGVLPACCMGTNISKEHIAFADKNSARWHTTWKYLWEISSKRKENSYCESNGGKANLNKISKDNLTRKVKFSTSEILSVSSVKCAVISLSVYPLLSDWMLNVDGHEE